MARPGYLTWKDRYAHVDVVERGRKQGVHGGREVAVVDGTGPKPPMGTGVQLDGQPATVDALDVVGEKWKATVVVASDDDRPVLVCTCGNTWLSIERHIRPAVPTAGLLPGEGARPNAVASRYRLLCPDCDTRWSLADLLGQQGTKKPTKAP